MKPPVVDSQFDEQHGVLRNKLNVVDSVELTAKISEYATARLMQLQGTPLRGKFDIPHLKDIHRHIFQDVFPWAGDFREVMTSRSGSFGFPPPIYIEPALFDLFSKLKDEKHVKGLDADRFADRAGYYMGELNAVHPFREGNGRTQREFIRTLGLYAGHRISWRNITKEENDHASRVSFAKGDHSGLAAIIRKCLL